MYVYVFLSDSQLADTLKGFLPQQCPAGIGVGGQEPEGREVTHVDTDTL